jgi:hypothetical protein
MKRLVRLASLAAAVAAVVAAIRALRRDADPLPAAPTTPSEPWPPLRVAEAEPGPDVVRVPEPDGVPVADASTAPWVEPTAEGECPDGYPIKAKMSSKIFHAPGQLNYDRTTPDRCYVDAGAAEADGLRAAKR